MLRFPAPLICRTRPEPVRPLTVPPTANAGVDVSTLLLLQPATSPATQSAAAAASPDLIVFVFIAGTCRPSRYFNFATPRVKGLFPVDPFRAPSCAKRTLLRADC